MNPIQLKSWRKKNGFTQSEVADVIGQTPVVISKIERGTRKISPAEEKLLENFIKSIDATSQNKNAFELYFTPNEWSQITKLAVSDGIPEPVKWIVSKIKNYIAMHG